MANKTKKNKMFGIGGIIVVVIILIIIFYFTNKAKAKNSMPMPTSGGGTVNNYYNTGSTISPGSVSPTSPTAGIDIQKELKLGSRGDEVKELQMRLNSIGKNLTVDGIFGPATKTALKDVTGYEKITLAELLGFLATAY